jgi:lipopolysaccharide export system permease protein
LWYRHPFGTKRMHVKTLHIYLIKKYIPPFLATLFIGMFIFFMIFIFTYIDEIAGKGVEGAMLAKMFVYMFLTFLPPSMPLAVLLSSIMTFGGLGETYELASMKSAGLSLISIMKPVLIFIFAMAGFCFLFNNYTLPLIHLKAARLLYDVRGAKPAFKLKESVFYNGIDGYSIRVGSKDNDGKTIHNIFIYDHSEGKGNVSQVYAKDGEISVTDNARYLTIKLKNGNRYQQIMDEPRHERTRPDMIVHFKEQVVRIDLTSLKVQSTDEQLFKNHAEMMNVTQLKSYGDTAVKTRLDNYANTYKQFVSQYYFQRSLMQFKTYEKDTSIIPIEKYLAQQTELKRKNILESAQNLVKSASSFLDSKVNEEYSQVEEQAKFDIEWHKKFTLSFACIILFFVGAPLGAIVRKGGFGMPVIISVFLFITYHVISFSLEKMVLQDKLMVIVGMWAAPMLFLPLGFWLTNKAARDSPLFDMTRYIDFYAKIISKFKRTDANTAA